MHVSSCFGEGDGFAASNIMHNDDSPDLEGPLWLAWHEVWRFNSFIENSTCIKQYMHRILTGDVFEILRQCGGFCLQHIFVAIVVIF